MIAEHDIQQIQDHLAAFTGSFVAPVQSTTYSDEYIEHWAIEYNARRIWRYGVLFGVFVRHPHQILDALLQRGFLPLLPEQKKVQRRLDGDDYGSTDPRTIEALSKLWFKCDDRPGANQLQPPALHGDRLVQSMHPRLRLPRWKTSGGRA